MVFVASCQMYPGSPGWLKRTVQSLSSLLDFEQPKLITVRFRIRVRQTDQERAQRAASALLRSCSRLGNGS
jgi:hypothetical protein